MKWSIRRKMNVIVFICVMALTVVLAAVNYYNMKSNLLESVSTKLVSDIQLSRQYIESAAPGEWAIIDGDLHKGDVNLVGNTEFVDAVGELTEGNAVSMFQGNTRISTNIIENGERSVNTKVSAEVEAVVLGEKKRFTGVANVLGEEHEAAYEPILDSKGDVIGIWSTAVPTKPYIDIAKNGLVKDVAMAILMAVIAIFAISIFIRNQISRPLNSLKNTANDMAALNLGTKVLKPKSYDEIASLARAFHVMQEKLKETIETVNDNAAQVATSSQVLAGSSQQTSEASSQIAHTINEMAAGVVDQGDRSERIMQMMKITIDEVTESLQQVELTLENAHNSTLVAKEGEAAINEAIKHLGAVTQTVSYATDSIQKLGKRSEEIGGIITVITGLADQTNLLALNAAIEAARAGEHGKGFAVVASEVRQLAEQSRLASGQITELIGDIQVETSVTVRTMESNLLAVEEQVNIITKGGEALEEIVERVVETEHGVEQMRHTLEKVNANSLDVQDAIQDISVIIEEAAASSEQVAATSEEQYATISEISANTEELATVAENLKLEVEKFKF